MPRPTPLRNPASGRTQLSDYQSLTPRTPHSRSGRAEEALGAIEIEKYEDDDRRAYQQQQQSEPLLVSSSTPLFPPSGYRSRGDDHGLGSPKEKSPYLLIISALVNRIPLVFGIGLAFILLVSIIISFKHPDALLRFIGATNITVGDDAVSISPHPNLSDPNLISYENYTNFPLLPTEYAAECYKLTHGLLSPGGYWEHEPQDVPHREKIDGHGLADGYRNAVCSRTITYMLDGHVGLLADLALMLQVAALARDQNRTFLVDDRYWNRGKWTDHFQDVRSRQPGPEPGCKAPPPEELVACPRTARHWIVNSRTARYHFGEDNFIHAFSDPYGHSLNRWKPIFNAALESITETVHPNAQNAMLIQAARDEMRGIIATPKTTPEQYLSVHLRRGDKHAVSWRYQTAGYVPIPEYVQALQDVSLRLPAHPGSAMAVYIASDSPSAEAELVAGLPSNSRLLSLGRSQNPDLRILASPKAYVQSEFDKLASDKRVNLTRGMVVDFAMLSGTWARTDDIIPKAAVCTISSGICRLSAVGFGWDRAFGVVNAQGSIDHETNGWVEIDNAGQIDPPWEAFELFY